MSWPKGRPRPKKVGTEQPSMIVKVGGVEQSPDTYSVEDTTLTFDEPLPREPNQPPHDWRKGALLNVRNRGDAYVITLHPEEYSDERPERGMRFTNSGECQDFVSRWYAPEHHDPRAR